MPGRRWQTEPINRQAILDFIADNDPPSEELMRNATTFLTRPDAVAPTLRGTEPDNQTKSLDKVHEARQGLPPSALAPTDYFYKGI